MVISIDTSVLMGYYQAKAGLVGATAQGGASGTGKKVAPTPPWSAPATPKEASAAVTAALAGRKVIDENAAKLDLAGASSDYKKLFALYQGLGTLSDLAARIKEQGLTGGEKSRLQQVFVKGMAEVQGYLGSASFEKIRLAQGVVDTVQKAGLTVDKAAEPYVTPPLTTSASDPVPAFEGDVRFNIQVTRLNQVFDVAIDLSGMPDSTRSISNVVSFINDRLSAAGVETRFGTSRTAGEAKQIKAGSQTITLPAGPDQWALKVTVGSTESVSFSAPDTAGAVYMAQQVGDADPDHDAKTADSTIQQQFLKFQTDTDLVGAPPQTPGQANWVDGRVFANPLAAAVSAVRAQTVGPDGSIYMLAEVNGAVDGQTIKGKQDVALLKYDAAGALVFTRTLGAAESASGLGLAVSAEGKVAVTGSVSGALSGATDGALNSGTTGAYAGEADSFVTLFDKDGQELWTQRRGARQADEAGQVAFGADGTVYVAGQSKSAMPGAGAAQGDWDGYVEAFATDAAGKVSTLFTQGFGGVAADRVRGLVVDGSSLVVASVENGRAVLHRFDISGGAPVETATRDLGDLEGGDIQGLAIDAGGRLALVGTTANPGLDVGGVTRAASGGTDAFVARIDADLGGAGDRLAYYGGADDDRATAMAMADGQVWIAGTSAGDLPDQPKVGAQDGFLARIDVDAGAVDWSRRFTGTSGKAAPSAIAVAPDGASVLDRLGLPTGELSQENSQQITAVSAARAGDQFTISVNGGPARAVTIEADDTLDTLALKIRRASNFSAKVTISSVADGKRQLKIEPANTTSLVAIGPGKGDADALEQLGIAQGVVRATRTDKDGATVPADGKPKIYGLGLPADLNLDDSSQVSHALAELAAAQDVIRAAYKDLVAAATPKSAQTAAAAAKGTVPAYMKNQISNYQAALDRLVGGGGDGGASGGGGLFGL